MQTGDCSAFWADLAFLPDQHLVVTKTDLDHGLVQGMCLRGGGAQRSAFVVLEHWQQDAAGQNHFSTLLRLEINLDVNRDYSASLRMEGGQYFLDSSGLKDAKNVLAAVIQRMRRRELPDLSLFHGLAATS